MMVKFNDRMVTDVVQTFWAAMQRGGFITGAAAEAGTYRGKGRRWLRECGGVRPRRGRDLVGRCLSFAEREEMADSGGHCNRRSPISSIGFMNASRLRGRSLSSWATQSRSSLLCTPRSVPLGKYCLSRPLVFSLVPRC